MKTTTAILLCALGILAPVAVARADVAASFDKEKAMTLVRALADDAMEGRKSGLPGAQRAAQLAADAFRKWGLEPAGEKGTYFQSFPLRAVFTVDKASAAIVAAGQTRTFDNTNRLVGDWRVYDNSGSGSIRAEIVLAGFGLRLPKKGYDDYSGVDVRGKVVLISAAFPPKLAGGDWSDQALEKRLRDARALGAAAVLVVPDLGAAARSPKVPPWGNVDPKDYDARSVVLGVNEVFLKAVTKNVPLDPREYYATLQKEGKPRPVATGVEARLEVKASFQTTAQATNVLARFPGSDPSVRDEIVILGAHFDGLGIAPSGDVYHGANDNASGVAVVMEAARAMKAGVWKPRRSLVFALWGAEEIGLVGSTYYAEHPLYPLQKTVANINVDCVGQGARLGLCGIYFASELFDLLKAKLPAEMMADMSPRQGVGGSDHMSFLGKGVPAFHVAGVDGTLKIHTPADDVGLIQPELIDKAGRFAVAAAVTLADTQQTLIPEGREWLTKLRYEDTVNCRLMPLAEATAKVPEAAKEDVDYQLATVTLPKGAPPEEARAAITKELGAAAAKSPSGSGLMALLNRLAGSTPGSAQRGLKPILGLGDARLARDASAWLASCAPRGLKFVVVRNADLEMAGTALNEPSKRLIEAADRAKIIVILDGVDSAKAAAALSALTRPGVLLAEETPTGPLLAALNARRHVLGLRWRSGVTPEAYFERLTAARTALGSERLILWNERDLWSEAKQDYAKLIGLMMGSGWDKRQHPMSRQCALADVWSLTWLGLVRGR